MEDAVLSEQKKFIEMINQMKDMHEVNKSVVRALDFLEECVLNRMPAEVEEVVEELSE